MVLFISTRASRGLDNIVGLDLCILSLGFLWNLKWKHIGSVFLVSISRKICGNQYYSYFTSEAMGMESVRKSTGFFQMFWGL